MCFFRFSLLSVSSDRKAGKTRGSAVPSREARRQQLGAVHLNCLFSPDGEVCFFRFSLLSVSSDRKAGKTRGNTSEMFVLIVKFHPMVK